MPAVTCPRCGEPDNLAGKRRPDGTLEVTCNSCGTVWERHGDRRCRLCGSADLRYTPKPLWERGRGEQRTPAGEIPAYACWTCGGTDVTSANANPAKREP
jgi:hypothetical protein